MKAKFSTELQKYSAAHVELFVKDAKAKLEREERKAAERKRLLLIDDYKHAIRHLTPVPASSDTFDVVDARLLDSKEFAFASLTETERQEAFARVMARYDEWSRPKVQEGSGRKRTGTAGSADGVGKRRREEPDHSEEEGEIRMR